MSKRSLDVMQNKFIQAATEKRRRTHTAKHITKMVNARRTSSSFSRGVTRYENRSPARANGNMGFRNEGISTDGSRLIHPMGAKMPTPIICVEAAKATASCASMCFMVRMGRKTTPPATGCIVDVEDRSKSVEMMVREILWRHA
jgi:hypothetical protein